VTNGHVARSGDSGRDFEPVSLAIEFAELCDLLDSVSRPQGPGQDGGYPLAGLAERVEEYARSYDRALRFHRKVLAARAQFRFHGRAVCVIENDLEHIRLSTLLQRIAIPAIRPDGGFTTPDTLRTYAVLEQTLRDVIDVATARSNAAKPKAKPAGVVPPEPPPPPPPPVTGSETVPTAPALPAATPAP
jgi:hypothetical protein